MIDASLNLIRAGSSANGCGSVGSAAGRRAAVGLQSPVFEHEICHDRQFVVTGDTMIEHVVGPVLEGIGPRLQDVVVHSRGRAFSTSFQYRIGVQWSYAGESWSATVWLDAAQTGTSPVIGNVYSTRTSFGRRIRFIVGVSGGASSTDDGLVSASVALRLFS